jgi:hypothetical protein
MQKHQHQLSVRRKAGENIGELIILDQGRYDFPNSDVTILGVTLYTHILKDQEQAVFAARQEFQRIQDWDVVKHNAAHASDVAYLNDQIESISQRRIVVFSHYSPTIDHRTIDPWILQAVKSGEIEDIGSGFNTDLRGEKCWDDGNGVVYWAWGHTHFNVDFWDEVCGRRCVTNQAEDVEEGKVKMGFNEGFVLEV